jgi:HlyD family secretion protein
VDTITLHLKKKQLEAKIRALSNKTINIPSQINVLIERKSNLERDKKRIKNLYEAGAATQKQWDDIQGELQVINSEIKANRERLETNNAGLLSEILPLQYQIEEINDQINRAILYNPVHGTVLTKYSEENEIVSFGKPLYRIADINRIILRAYISGSQLDDIKIGQKVTVLIDKNKSDYRSYPGTISWISDKAEFTPKIVQTKEERVNLVYAIKILVENDGAIKIGMPGEVVFNENL